MPTKTPQSKIPKLRFPSFSGGWEEKKLGDVFVKIRNGFVGIATPFYVHNGVPYLQGKNIKDGQIIDDGLIYVSKIFHEKQKNSQLKEGDLLMVQSGHVGECAVVDHQFVNGNCHAILVMTPKKEAINSNFIKNIFYSKIGLKIITKITTGNTIQHVLASDIGKIKTNIPSLLEQQKIAEFLGATDEWIENLHTQKESFESYKKGMMQKIFSQEIRFKDDNGKNFPRWEEKKFLDVFKTISTKNYQIKNSGILASGKYKVVDQSKDLIAGFSNDDTKLLKGKSFIVFGDHTGILKYIDFDFVVGADGTKILEARDKDNLKFLYYSLQANPINTEGYKRHYSILKDREILTPSILEQQKIAEFLTSVDKVIEAKQQQITYAEQWKKGLMQGLFV